MMTMRRRVTRMRGRVRTVRARVGRICGTIRMSG